MSDEQRMKAVSAVGKHSDSGEVIEGSFSCPAMGLQDGGMDRPGGGLSVPHRTRARRDGSEDRNTTVG
jgi:hypothetical protein